MEDSRLEILDVEVILNFSPARVVCSSAALAYTALKLVAR